MWFPFPLGRFHTHDWKASKPTKKDHKLKMNSSWYVHAYGKINQAKEITDFNRFVLFYESSYGCLNAECLVSFYVSRIQFISIGNDVVIFHNLEFLKRTSTKTQRKCSFCLKTSFVRIPNGISKNRRIKPGIRQFFYCLF